MLSAFDVFLPIHNIWWTLLGIPISLGMDWLYTSFQRVPALAAIGAYGLALIVITVGIKLLLSPLFEWQIRTGKKTLENQRKVAPELAEIRKTYKGDPQKQQAAQMELYRERGINPLSSMVGCLPSLIQLPILYALYSVFHDGISHVATTHFLFVPSLAATPKDVPLIPGLPIPTIVYLVIPLLAAASTFVQSRMMQQPPNPAATEQEQQTQQMMKSMQVVMPFMVLFFAATTPVGLSLYWLIGNCFTITQQYRVNGWGGFRKPAPAPAVLAAPEPQSAPRPRRAQKHSSRPSQARRTPKRRGTRR